jgi:secreted trypsin-like serine protease
VLKEEPCFGDSGGPLVAKSESGAFVQIGVLSEGSGFCSGFLGVHAPDLYTRVILYLPWIRKYIGT